MSTLTDLSLREVFETPGSRVVADLLVREGFAVAEAEGIVIPHDEAAHILDKVLPCFFAPKRNVGSSLIFIPLIHCYCDFLSENVYSQPDHDSAIYQI